MRRDNETQVPESMVISEAKVFSTPNPKPFKCENIRDLCNSLLEN